MKRIAIEFRPSLRCDIVSEAILTDHVGGNCGENLEHGEEEAFVEDHLLVFVYWLFVFYFCGEL